jgi:hypothetical protein
MALAAIAAWLGRTTGINAAILGDQRLQRAVQARMTALQENSLASYQQRLEQASGEGDALVESLVVPETWFFRDGKPFDVLQRHVIAMALRRPQDQPLRILSAPCSSGEEPFSIVIALRELGLPRQAYAVQALDISRQALARAERGLYGLYLRESRRIVVCPRGNLNDTLLHEGWHAVQSRCLRGRPHLGEEELRRGLSRHDQRDLARLYGEGRWQREAEARVMARRDPVTYLRLVDELCGAPVPPPAASPPESVPQGQAVKHTGS